MPAQSNFRENKHRDDRKIEAAHIKSKYPDRIPIILEKSKTCTIKEDPDPNAKPKTKWLVPMDMTVEQYIKAIRKKSKFIVEKDENDQPIDEPLYLYINNAIVATEASLQYLYEKNVHTDGYLYIKYSNVYNLGKLTSTLLNSLNPWGTVTAESKKSVNSTELEMDVPEE